ncbi:hypothetical protein TIFTF001_055746 [Ficus carica]|uniref:Uncharacterized protein n=1 Tax=Ficus carica TaxID=3494 RepID=A0AA88EFA5_FICCA|nr:hypothetical protein TIFTF001_055743 [Ficus carica]GMN73831.1 hypothetical protein TIFTF001_055744 [Ficus carica]GMN73837.1 hypothetical protein TIFTF001_055745 [Ficus carica]GMN73842.1 hypothetical protein TIFTF001_055746 [Ficus carica]
MSFIVSISRVAEELYSQSPHAGKNSSTRDEQKKYIGAEIKTECTSDDDLGIHQLRRAEEEKSEHPRRKVDAEKGQSKGKFANSKSGNQTAVHSPLEGVLRIVKLLKQPASSF